MGSDRVQVSFTIAHVGTHPGASFYRYDTDCDTSITNTDKYNVYLEFTSEVAGSTPTCNGLVDGTPSAGFIQLFEGQPRTITCTVDASGVQGVYEDLFEVNLRYRYLQSIEKPLEIRDVSIN
jgi:hypothetical protein